MLKMAHEPKMQDAKLQLIQQMMKRQAVKMDMDKRLYMREQASIKTAELKNHVENLIHMRHDCGKILTFGNHNKCQNK